MRNKIKKLITVNIIVFICVLLFIAFSIISNRFGLTKCMFLNTFHLYCPGCGGTRALFALLRFDIVASIQYNPTVLAGIIVYLYYNIRALVEIKRKNEKYFSREKYYLIIIVVAIMIINFFLKNIILFNGIDVIGDVFGEGAI